MIVNSFIKRKWIFIKVLSELKDMVSKETRKLVKRLDQVEEKLQPRSLIQK